MLRTRTPLGGLQLHPARLISPPPESLGSDTDNPPFGKIIDPPLKWFWCVFPNFFQFHLTYKTVTERPLKFTSLVKTNLFPELDDCHTSQTETPKIPYSFPYLPI